MQKFEKKKRGGQPGNCNAAGRGAPKGNANATGHGPPFNNKNAMTHGAYERLHLENLSPEEREYIESLTLDAKKNMLRELQLLSAKERDLTRKIKYYENTDPAELFIDRVIEMLVPKNKDDNNQASKNKKASIDELKTAMRTVIKSSPFDRAMKLEAEYNKTHGRILKLIDIMRGYEIDNRRLELDERKHTLAKQRVTGEYIIDLDTGELVDTERAEDADGLSVE